MWYSPYFGFFNSAQSSLIFASLGRTKTIAYTLVPSEQTLQSSVSCLREQLQASRSGKLDTQQRQIHPYHRNRESRSENMQQLKTASTRDKLSIRREPTVSLSRINTFAVPFSLP